MASEAAEGDVVIDLCLNHHVSGLACGEYEARVEVDIEASEPVSFYKLVYALYSLLMEVYFEILYRVSPVLANLLVLDHLLQLLDRQSQEGSRVVLAFFNVYTGHAMRRHRSRKDRLGHAYTEDESVVLEGLVGLYFGTHLGQLVHLRQQLQ